MIKEGNKREEYREIKPYWTKRLINTDGSFKNFTHIKFRCGYTNQFIIYRIEDMTIDKGKVEWGGIENKEVYVIKFADKQLKEEFNEIFNDVISKQVTEYYVDGKVDTNILIGLFVKRIRALFSDETMEFKSNYPNASNKQTLKSAGSAGSSSGCLGSSAGSSANSSSTRSSSSGNGSGSFGSGSNSSSSQDFNR